MQKESRNIINQELQEIAPALAAMDYSNPFQIPSGYFDAQGEALSFGVSEQEEIALHSSLIAARNVNPFQVPVDYFKGLIATVMGSIQAQTVEPALGAELTAMRGKNPFTVPAAYFQELGANVWGRVNKEEGIGMSREAASSSFKVPANYFETLPNRILDRVREEEGKEKGKVRELKEVGEKAPKVNEPAPEKAKGVGIRRMLTFATAAAAVLLLMFVGSGLFDGGVSDPIVKNDPFNLEETFASLSDDDFSYFLEQADLDADAIGEYIDMDHISEFDDLDDELLNEMLLLDFDENIL